MRNAITAFSIFKELNLDLKSLELMACSGKAIAFSASQSEVRRIRAPLRSVSFRRTLLNEQRPFIESKNKSVASAILTVRRSILFYCDRRVLKTNELIVIFALF